MKLLIKDAFVLTMTSKDAPVVCKDIAIEEGMISHIGEVPSAFIPDKIIDGTGHIAMPGLINAHTHMAMSLLRNYADDLPLMEWLSEKIWPVEGHLNGEAVYAGTLLSLVELIRSGVTTYRDMYFYMEDVARATEAVGLRAVLGLGMVGVTDPEQKLLSQTKAFFHHWHLSCDGRIRVEVAPHAPYTCSDGYLKAAFELSQSLETTMHIHLSESLSEVKASYDSHGVSPVKHLEDLGVLNKHVSAAHCVHIDQKDIEILKQHGVSVLYNPSSNLKLGNGFAPIAQLMEAGVNVAIGTDGSASNNNLNLFEELHLAALVNKGVTGDPTALPVYKVLEIATINGAKALGIDHLVGTLEVGKRADLILIDLEKPHLVPHHDLVSAVVYSAAATDVSHVICDGVVLMEDYQLTCIDEKNVMTQAKLEASKLIKRHKGVVE